MIDGLPHQTALRIGMTMFGAVLYFAVVRLLAISIRPFAPDRAAYNTVGRIPYYAACLFSCAAGALIRWASSCYWSPRPGCIWRFVRPDVGR